MSGVVFVVNVKRHRMQKRNNLLVFFCINCWIAIIRRHSANSLLKLPKETPIESMMTDDDIETLIRKIRFELPEFHYALDKTYAKNKFRSTLGLINLCHDGRGIELTRATQFTQFT